MLLYASTWIPLSWSNDRACSQISCVSLITSSREFPERYWNCVEFKACISRIFPYVCVEFFNVENIDTYVSLFFQHVSDVYRTRMSCAQFETKTKIQIICLVCVGVFTRDLWWRHLVRFPILIRFPRIARRRGLRTRLNFQLGVCFFFLLEMLKMFTSSVITSLGIVPLRRYVYLFLVLLFLNLPMSSCLWDFIAEAIRQFAMQIYCHILDPFF